MSQSVMSVSHPLHRKPQQKEWGLSVLWSKVLVLDVRWVEDQHVWLCSYVRLQLVIYFTVFIFYFNCLKCLKHFSSFPEAGMISSNCWICPTNSHKLKFSIINVKEQQQIHKFKKLKLANAQHVCLKNEWKDWLSKYLATCVLSIN